MTIHSPLNIEILLWCHCMPQPYPFRQSQAESDCIKMLREEGAIEPRTFIHPETGEDVSDGGYTTTELGKAWVQALCNVPTPKRAFLDEMGRVLE